MTQSPRRTGSRSHPNQFDSLDTDELLEPSPDVPLDPAHVAASLIIRQTLAAQGYSLKEAAADGVVIVIMSHGECWTRLARDAWRDLARGGQKYSDAEYDRGWYGHSWMACLADKELRAKQLEEAGELFATAVAKGYHYAAFTADLTWLHPDVVHAADYRLTLPPLAGADMGVVALQLCGGKVDEFLSDSQAAILTPRLLRLARRLGQTADAYIRKLHDLLERDAARSAAPAPTASPRDVPTLDRMHGMDEAVSWGTGVARDLAAFKAGRLDWAAVDRGCLLSGNPGCGKTLFARALANTCGVPLVTGSYGEWHGTGNAHQGDLLKAMRKTFATARSSSPSILFIDEVDSFPNRGTITHHFAEWEIQVVNALLAEIDGVEGRDGVILVAACNHPERLDPALVRSGRLDRHIRIGMPDRPALAAILREHLGDELRGEDLSAAALSATGASGADCERIVRGARRRARAAERAMTMADLLAEIGGADDRSAGDLWISAVHEAGHVAAACILWPGSVGMVSLRSSGDTGGVTSTARTSVLMRPADLLDRLAVSLAGRAAEEEIFGVASSGAGGRADSDLARATALAVTASSAFGLDDLGGLVWRGMPEPHLVPQALTADPALADRVRIRLNAAYGAARQIIRPRRAAVEALATALVERRVLDGAEAEAIVLRHAPTEGEVP